MWDALEDQGYRLAAIGGSDDHTAGIDEGPTGSPIGSPTTLVRADELSEAAIVAAGEGRGPPGLPRGAGRAPLGGAGRGANGAAVGIGDTASGISSIQVDAHVVGAAPGDGVSLSIVRDGKPADQVPVDSADFRKSFTYAARGGPERVRAELIADGARIV